MNKTIYFFRCSGDPSFFRATFCDYPLGSRATKAQELLHAVRNYYPAAKPPYIVFLRAEQVGWGKEEIFYLRNDSSTGVGGIQGLLSYFINSKEMNPKGHDPLSPVGLAALINEEWNRPESHYTHNCPANFIVSYMGESILLSETLEVLKKDYEYKVETYNL